MDRKQMCISNLTYKKPTRNEQKRMKNLLKYLTYRDSRDKYVPQVTGMERWVNRGMGKFASEVADRCDAYQSEHVLLFSLVANPNPDLIQMVSPEDREQFVRRLTENVVEDFFEARGIDTGVEFSYVYHSRFTDDKEAPGRHDPHTHIVLPGTYYHADEGRRVPLYFSRNKSVNHVEMLHTITEDHMAQLMDRYVGINWEQRYDALDQQRQQQKQVVESEPHGVFRDVEDLQPFWCGTRQYAEGKCAIGYYIPTVNKHTDEPEIQFRPIANGLDADYAHELSSGMPFILAEQEDDIDQLELYIETIRIVLDEEHEDIQTRPTQPEFDAPSLDL
jgi:hypothetical protein